MKKPHCPTCGRAFDAEKSPAMPFCSVRCREVDLGRWLDEKNTVPCDLELAEEIAAADKSDQKPD